MDIKNITFANGYITITDQSGNEVAFPVLAKLAQVVMALIRLLMEQGLLDDTTLVSDNEGASADVTLQSLLDKLIDYYGVDYGNENAPK